MTCNIYVIVNFYFPFFWGMIMYANEFKTRKKQKLTEVKKTGMYPSFKIKHYVTYFSVLTASPSHQKQTEEF